jgi:hypothetical protein
MPPTAVIDRYWVAALLLGVALGVGTSLVWSTEPPATCQQTTAALTIADQADPRRLSAGTEFRLGRIADNAELWIPVRLPDDTMLEACRDEGGALHALEVAP